MGKQREPRVYTADVRELLRRHVRPELDDQGEAVALIAEQAGTSARTVYRVLDGSTKTIGLDLADRLLVAVGENLSWCKIKE